MSNFNRRSTARPQSTPRAFANACGVLLVVSSVVYYWVRGRIDEHRLELTRPENRNFRELTWEEVEAHDAAEALKQAELKSRRTSPARPSRFDSSAPIPKEALASAFKTSDPTTAPHSPPSAHTPSI